jgi:signal transduction histidine kinase
MSKKLSLETQPIEIFIPWFFLLILLFFTYAYLFEVPYVGFDFNLLTGEVLEKFVDASAEHDLRVGDRILQVGSVRWEEYRLDAHRPVLRGVKPGEVIPIQVERGGQTLDLVWEIPGFNAKEFLSRLIDFWWLGYLFWVFGTIAAVFVRPKDTLWLLLILFMNFFAIFIHFGVISRWRVWGSAVLFGVVAWLLVPISLHLHWFFPKPLGRLPAKVSYGVYLLGFLLAALQFSPFLPRYSYRVALLLVFLGGLTLLILHYLLRPDQRRDIGPLSLIFGIASLPVVGLIISRYFGVTTWSEGGVVLALPTIPGAYLFVLYRRRLGGLEYRINRLISIYLFAIILVFVSSVIAVFTRMGSISPAIEVFAEVLCFTIFGVISATVFPIFQQYVERRLFGIPIHSRRLLETYAERITTSLDVASLVRLIESEVLPSLLIRQSLLLQISEDGSPMPLMNLGLEGIPLPTEDDLPWLIDHSGIFLQPKLSQGLPQNCQWIRLVLPLITRGKVIGLWMFGRRDPDNIYSQADLATLKTLAHQTAIALTNIQQAESLRALYQVNIERQEQERMKLAHFLHDEVLNPLAGFAMQCGSSQITDDFFQVYHSLSESIRETISGLRPAIINHGLYPALRELMENFSERAGGKLEVIIDLPPSDVRYDSEKEVHIYRMVQQAGENVLKHAHAKTMRLYGALEQDKVCLVIEDDGVGFPMEGRCDLTNLVANKHYGLAGMYERAALIGGEIQIVSSPKDGTKVIIHWSPQ